MKRQTKSLNKIFLGFIAIVMLFLVTAVETTAATRTWDGGGATNNWSDAANWSGDVAPTASDDAIFNNTSVKNATIDQNFSIAGVQVASGYDGTITQTSATVTVSGSFMQSAGNFQGGSGTLTINGTLQITGGSFVGGSGLITGGFGFQINQSGGTFSSGGNLELTTFTLSGGTFNAPNGTMTVVADWTNTGGGTFNAGTGTVKITGYSVYNCANSMTVNVDVTQTFNNLQFDNQACNTRYIAGGDTLIVNGELRLSNGSVNSGRIRPLGTIVIDSSFSSNAGSTVVEMNAPNRNYVINNPSSTASMLPVEMSAATSTLTSSGGGKINFYGLTLTAGTLNQPNTIWDFTTYPGYAQSGGTFNGSSAQLNISNGINGNILTGGVFNGGTGFINGGWGQTGGTFSTTGDMYAPGFILSGGTFNAPLGTFSVGGFTHTSGGTFNPRTGTVQTPTIPGTYAIYFDVNSTETFNNLQFNGTYNSANHGIASGDTLIVNGTLTFNGRGVNGGSIAANGNVSHTNYGAYRGATTIVKFEDTATRTVTLCGDAGSCSNSPEFDTQPILVNNPNITINAGLTANGSMIVPALTLQQGTFNQGAGRVTMTNYNQSGGTYNGGTFGEAFGSLNSFTYFTLTGGDFNAAPSMSLTGNFTHTTATGNFNEGTGTVYFYSTFFGTNGTIDVNTNETFYNAAFYSGNGTNIANGDTLTISGTTNLRGGTLNGGTIDAKGDVIAPQTNVGGSFQGGTTNAVFSGSATQTFTNLDGRATFGGNWTINKPNSAPLAENNFAPAAPTTLLVSGAIGNAGLNSFPPLNIVSGNVVQTGNFSHALGSLTLASNGRFTNEYGGTLTLAGNVVNNGLIQFNGNGAGCQADSILIRSSSATQRTWDGSGYFFMTDVDASYQGGTANIRVYSGTNSGNNGANWIFDPSCFAPTASNASISGRVLMANGNGIANANVVLTDANGQSRVVSTNAFGFYQFEEVAVGQTVVLTVKSKRFVFSAPTRIINVGEDIFEANFIANER